MPITDMELVAFTTSTKAYRRAKPELAAKKPLYPLESTAGAMQMLNKKIDSLISFGLDTGIDVTVSVNLKPGRKRKR
jgi:hypothetical protein